MGDGRVHFRFQREEELQVVLDNRPYHYDGSMLALERWVPTIKREFPSTIPFWIIIRGLPDYRREEKTVQRIGEDLGEFHEVDVSEPVPKIRVTLDCNSPLILRRETDDAGTLCVLDLQYEKLQRYCTRCLRLTHEAPACPERPREYKPQCKARREPSRRREVEPVKGRQRNQREDRRQTVAPPRLDRDTKAKLVEVVESSSKSRQVHRDLLAELESSRVSDVEPKVHNSTKEWLRRTFGSDKTSGGSLKASDIGDGSGVQSELKRAKTRAPWYRTTIEEAAVANETFSQAEKWDAAEILAAQVEDTGTAVSTEVEAEGRMSRSGVNKVVLGLQIQKSIRLKTA
ncbi:hypothetical protein AALP_AAs49159U000100 [Arabis alpina]|uniref:DUF4283 domain-containing protein n=1 Tax=Arabis alpina TaxID=50452 RepID=A0A087FX87_ARAAL|nr:hypothetical protein AALP_AAs49159U000100 [Arabis alpina]